MSEARPMSETDTEQGERLVHGACQHDCPDNCAMETLVRDGRVVSVRGRREHPFTHGVLCAKVKGFEKRVYAPDRILHPMARIGAKGEGRFERISWDEALDEIAGRFHDIIAADGAEAILPCSYLGTQGLLNGLHVGDRVFNALGASVGERTFCNSGASKAFRMVCGPTGGLDPESFAKARFIILWGINIVSTAMHHWRFVKQAVSEGARLVVIDPLRSRTAALAHWHVRPKPGTDVALALAMIRQIIADDAIDRAYVADHVQGDDALAARAGGFTPDRAAEITGVPADEIVALARAYAGTRPAAIRTGVALERTRNGPDAVRAIACLPALTGAWRDAGGGMFQHPHATFPIDREALTGARRVEEGRRTVNLFGLAQALDPAAARPIRALFVYNANPVTACAEQALLVRRLAREDLFTVVSEIFPTDTTDHADIVLPATSQLEQDDLMYSWGHFNLQHNARAIPPRGEAVSNTELFRRLAARLGLDDPDLARDDADLMDAALDWDSPQLDGVSLDRLRAEGFHRLSVGTADRRLPHADGGFPTPSGKCEVASSVADAGGAMLPLYRQGVAHGDPGGRVDPLPDFDASAPSDRPYTLISPKTHHFLNSGYANLQPATRATDVQPVWVNPRDAERERIVDGQEIRVFNDLGEIRAAARVTEDTIPGVVVVSHGFWRKHVGGATVNALVPHRPAAIGRAPAINEARVSPAPA